MKGPVCIKMKFTKENKMNNFIIFNLVDTVWNIF